MACMRGCRCGRGLDVKGGPPVSVRALVVPADAQAVVWVVEVEPSQDVWCDLVGDVGTDTVFAVDGSALVKVAMSGKREGRAVNVRASALVEWLVPGFAKVDRVLGDAVVVGLGDDGDVADVPEALVDRWGTSSGV